MSWRFLWLAVVCLSLAGCGGSLRSQSPPAKRQTGFWYWKGSSAQVSSDTGVVDVLFVHAGTIGFDSNFYTDVDHVHGDIPSELPAAREYWLVFRYDRQQVPPLSKAAPLARTYSDLLLDARERHLQIAGIQLDIDSPTAALPQYAKFLQAVRKELPPGTQISITGLLDWFRSGTAIADVIREADEFIPQFYDAADRNTQWGGGTIAAKIDGKRWDPVFNRFGKPFRIGISSFGRALALPRAINYPGLGILADLAPMDIGVTPGFSLQQSVDEAKELILDYRATRKIRLGYNNFKVGDTVQFIVPTIQSIRSAVEQANKMTGHFAGVVFFRWPHENESLVLPPSEVLRAAGLASPPKTPDSIDVDDGSCVAVKCVDLYLLTSDSFSSYPVRYRIHSSTELEYFLPEDRMPIRMTSPTNLELALPPFGGRPRMYLGRAVAMNRSDFTVERLP